MLLSQAKLTFPLKKKALFISSYQSFFVFGIIDNSVYTTYMLINSYEFQIFYKCLRHIVEFLSSNNNAIDLTLIENLCENRMYHWDGKVNINKKEIRMYINKEQVFCLDEISAEAMLIALPDIFLSCLLLTSDQKFFLLSFKSHIESYILLLKNNEQKLLDYCLNFAKQFNHIDVFDIFQIFHYFYKEIVILIQINSFQDD